MVLRDLASEPQPVEDSGRPCFITSVNIQMSFQCYRRGGASPPSPQACNICFWGKGHLNTSWINWLKHEDWTFLPQWPEMNWDAWEFEMIEILCSEALLPSCHAGWTWTLVFPVLSLQEHVCYPPSCHSQLRNEGVNPFLTLDWCIFSLSVYPS